MKNYTSLFLLIFGICTSSFCQTSLCEDALSVTLPFSTTDDTANYGNNYFGNPGNSCGNPNNFLNGNDVVYAYTATFNGSINLFLSTNIDDVGLFVYSNCGEIGQNCLAGTTNQQTTDATISIQAFPVLTGITYYFVISTWAPPETAAYSLNILENSCTNATVNYTVVSDCSISDEFFVEVNISNLGSATSLTIADNLGNPTQNVTAQGVVTFGPYANGTRVLFTVANDQDANCLLTSAPQTQAICAPVNNFCSNATDLAMQISPIDGTTRGATNKNFPSCSSNGASGDVYYSLQVPNGFTLTIGQLSNNYDSVVTAFYGDCTNQIELTCFDDDDLTTFTYFNNTGTSQTFYWVQDGFNDAEGIFTLSWQLSSCVPPDAVYTIVADCQNGEQFLVNANVFNLGSATSVTVFDNQGSGNQTVTQTGSIQFGPYLNNTQVAFTAVNDQDSSCFLASGPVTQEVCPATCTNASVNFDFFLDCGNTEGYFINANITNLGTAASITISENQGSPSQNVTSTGAYQFGPYPSYTTVIFTIADNLNADCVQSYNVQSFSSCPPSNDNCTNAISLNVGSDLASGALITSSIGATLSSELPIPSCGNMLFTFFAKDVWYTAIVPASGNLTIETTGSGGQGFSVLTDSVLQVYSGDCAGLTPVVCDNDGGTDYFSLISLTGRTPGEILYIRAFGAGGSQGSFVISAYDSNLSNIGFDNNRFHMFPNPVKDILYLTYSKRITNVEVYNLLGQQIRPKLINHSQSQIDMSNVSKGTYLIKVTDNDNQVKTIKIIKE